MKHKHKILDFIKKQNKPLTKKQISHMLNLPSIAIHMELSTLRNSGEISEITMEQLLRDGK